MNPETKNQNQPNYDFILQQGESNRSGKHQKNKKRLPFIVTVVGVVVSLIVFVIVLVLSANENVQQASPQAPANTPQIAAQNFIEAMDNQAYKEVVDNQLASELIYDESVNQQALERLDNSIDFSSCKLSEQQPESTTLIYACKSQTNEQNKNLILETVEGENGILISGHRIETL